MMRLALDLIYAAGLAISSPVWLYRMIRHGRYRDNIAQRFGAAPIRYGLQPIIWIHGVSLGEINAASSLVKELHSQLPDYRVVISATTETGLAAANRLFAPDHLVFHWPLDFSFSVARALDRARPDLVVLMEGEVWPNFVSACNRRKIPVVVINARMSRDKGYPRYKKLGPLAARLFNGLTAIGTQDESYAQRFISLGVNGDKVQVTGMLKFDSANVSSTVAGQDELAQALGITGDDKLIVAGGTGDGEEAMLLDIFANLRTRQPSARLAIVPRKPERFDEVARLIAGRNLPLIRRSQCQGSQSASLADRNAIILGDTMGELRKFYALASCVFVGRSLVPVGGSDMIESAALGKATAFGPHTFNFPQADALAEQGCAKVADAAELQRQLDAWLADPLVAQQAGKKAQDYVRSQQGATRRNVEMICKVLGRACAVNRGDIATEAIDTR
jgi:3-deoxy-D-manno-octulosonic-acid transferase